MLVSLAFLAIKMAIKVIKAAMVTKMATLSLTRVGPTQSLMGWHCSKVNSNAQRMLSPHQTMGSQNAIASNNMRMRSTLRWLLTPHNLISVWVLVELRQLHLVEMAEVLLAAVLLVTLMAEAPPEALLLRPARVASSSKPALG